MRNSEDHQIPSLLSFLLSSQAPSKQSEERIRSKEKYWRTGKYKKLTTKILMKICFVAFLAELDHFTYFLLPPSPKCNGLYSTPQSNRFQIRTAGSTDNLRFDNVEL